MNTDHYWHKVNDAMYKDKVYLDLVYRSLSSVPQSAEDAARLLTKTMDNLGFAHAKTESGRLTMFSVQFSALERLKVPGRFHLGNMR